MTKDKRLDVYYHGKHVGTLAQTSDKRIAFQYTADWLAEGFSISPFSLPLKNEVFIPAEDSRTVFRGMFGVFADSLPDSWGELLLDRHLADLGIDAGSLSALDRLAYVGNAGMGALEYRPSKDSDFNMDTVGLNYDVIAEECSRILSSKTSEELDVLYNLGGSSGGTRPKILLKENEKDWIIKFPAQKDPQISGKREYDYSLCAKRCGIVMTETGLIPSNNCEGFFKTERFDRKNGEKIFSVTFAGLLEVDFRIPSCDYSTYMKLVRVLTRENAHDLEQLYRVMCFNVLTENRDDHSKNFSFIYTEDQGWRLAPAYDLTYSDTYFGEHTTSVNEKGKNIDDADMIRVGTDTGLSKKHCIEILDNIKQETLSLKGYLSHKYVNRGKKTGGTSKVKEINKSL